MSTIHELSVARLAESASRLSDIAFRTCLADREGPVDLLARGLAALWFERDLTRLAGAVPRDLESAETALAAVDRRRTDPRAEANASAVVVRVLLEAGTLHRRSIWQAQRTVSLWQNLDPGHANTAEARIVLGQALLAAGHPIAGRRHLEEGADTRRSRFLLTSHRVQEDLIWLAKAALVLRHPRTVLELLAGQTAETDWFRDQVSFRLGYTARRLLTLASGELGRADEAAAALLADREELGDWPLDAGLDPLAADFDRSLAELALLRGEAADAASALGRLADAEAEAMGEGAGPGRPARCCPRTAGPSSCSAGPRPGWATPGAPRNASTRSPIWPPPGSIPATR